MLRHAWKILRSERAKVVLSWLWQVLVVLMISLCLIWLGARLPSEQPSVVVVEQQSHYACISDEAGTLLGCVQSLSGPHVL